MDRETRLGIFHFDLFWIVSARLITGFTPFLAVPILVVRFGEEEWVRIVVSQTCGAILAPIVAPGWGTIGPAGITRNNFNKYTQAVFFQKNTLFISISLLIFPCFFLFTSYEIWERASYYAAFLFSLSMGLSNSWVWNSFQNQKKIFSNEAIPKLLVGLIPIYFLRNLKDVSIYFLALALVNIFTSVLPLKLKLSQFNKKNINYLWKSNVNVGLMNFMRGLYFGSIVPVALFFNTPNIFEFTIMERAYRFSMSILLPFSEYAGVYLLRNSARTGFISRFGKAYAFQAILGGVAFLTIFFILNLSVPKSTKLRWDFMCSMLMLIFVVTYSRLWNFHLVTDNDRIVNVIKSLLPTTLTYLIAISPLVALMGNNGVILTTIVTELTFLFVMQKFTYREIETGSD